MNQLRQVLATIQTHLGRMSATQRMLLGSLAVIMVMSLFLVSQYASKPDMVALLPGVPVSEQAEMYELVRTTQPKAELGASGIIMVPASEIDSTRASLMEGGQLPGNNQLLFDNLIEQQHWSNSNQKNESMYVLALQNELGKYISMFSSVRKARVVVDVPPIQGIGARMTKGTASVVVEPVGGRLNQATVDAIAHLVASSHSRLAPEDVTIADTSGGHGYRISSEESLASGTYMELQLAYEKRVLEKVRDGVHQWVPGAIVLVTAKMDHRKKSEVSVQYSEKGEGTLALPRSEKNDSTVMTNQSAGAESGTRSNTAASINTGANSGSSTETTTDDIEFENLPGRTETHTTDPGGVPLFVRASIVVPRSYVQSVIESERGPPQDPENPPPAPTADEINARFPAIQQQISDLIEPIVNVDEVGDDPTTVVTVQLMPVDPPGLASSIAGGAGGVFGPGGSGGAGGGMLGVGGDMLDRALLGVLAIVSVGMMLMMVRKAGKRVALPTAEEIVGLPPEMTSQEEMIGEAGESEGALTALEVDDADVESQKMLEQVSMIVNQDAKGSAMLLQRWMDQEE